MIIDSSKLSFHDIMDAANKQHIPSSVPNGKIRPINLLIGGVVIITIAGIYYHYMQKKKWEMNIRLLMDKINAMKELQAQELSDKKIETDKEEYPPPDQTTTES